MRLRGGHDSLYAMISSLALLLGLLAQDGQAALTVSAAVSLTEALEEAAAAYHAVGGSRISFNFGGSNVLARQIVNGAPVDVFVSADDAQMDVVARASLVAEGTRTPLIANTLVLVADPHTAIMRVEDLVRDDVRRIAIGDPAAVPAGVYAKTYLENIGLWTRLAPRLVPTSNVRAALAAVQNGSASAALVYATDARQTPSLRVVATASGPQAPRIIYPACVVKSTRHAAAAAHFLAFLRSPVGAAIFSRRGFSPVTTRAESLR